MTPSDNDWPELDMPIAGTTITSGTDPSNAPPTNTFTDFPSIGLAWEIVVLVALRDALALHRDRPGAEKISGKPNHYGHLVVVGLKPLSNRASSI
jgi:hypothetical protein